MGVAAKGLKKGERPPVPDEKRCTKITVTGKRCSRPALKGQNICHMHHGKNAKSMQSKGGMVTAQIWADFQRRSKQLPVHSWEKSKIFICGNLSLILEHYKPQEYKAQILLQGWMKIMAKCLEAQDRRMGVGSEVTVVVNGLPPRPT